MILVDASIIIDFWKLPSENAKQIFENKEVFICGLTKAELYHGAKDKKQLNIIKKALSDFNEIKITENTWELLGDNLFLLKSNGITVPFQDALLATICIENNLEIWTLDKHFRIMQVVLDKLNIFL